MKSSNMLTILVLALGLMVCLPKVSEAAPVGTAWTYQGRLMDANQPADGEYDFRFKLYDDANTVTGNQVGSTIDINDLDVIDGYFTVELDFGKDIFSGSARWLEIAVRPGASIFKYRTLSPRQETTPAPYAIYAKTSGGDGDWTVSGNNMYSIPSGNVGIGTTSPTYKLDVAGSLRADGLRTNPNVISTNLIGGHGNNSVTSGAVAATIGGGGDSSRPNKVTDNYGTVGGGVDNQAGDNDGTVADATYATVSGGLENKASVEFATVGGGNDNTAGLRWTDSPTENASIEPSYSTIGGGQGNSARGPWSTIGGGWNNTASELVTVGEAQRQYPAYTTVGGGGGNTARGYHSTVGGGFNNTARESSSTVGGGRDNQANYHGSTISGGSNNIAWGASATVPGGVYNSAGGVLSFAAGYRAKVRSASEVGYPDTDGDKGTFVWADSTDADFQSTGHDQFLIRASGGVGIGMNSPNEKLTVEGALSLDEISAPSASAGYGKVYVRSDGELYFKNGAGTEYKLSAGGEDFVVGDCLLNANDTIRATYTTGPVLLKETKIGRGGSLRIKFDLSTNNAIAYVRAQIWRNNVAVGILRTTNSTSPVTFPEDISGWSKGDLVQVFGYTTNSDYPVYVSNLRLYVDNPAEAGARF